MKELSHIWFNVQEYLFPFLVKEDAPLIKKQQQLVSTLELIRIEEYVYTPAYRQGQIPRQQIVRAFVGKAVYNLDTTRHLIGRFQTDSLFRLIEWMEKGELNPT